MRSRNESEEKSTPSKIAETLASVRNNLGMLIEGRFPKYINSTLLWQNQEKHLANKIQDTDPPSIQFCKHCLLALESAERIAYIMQEYTNRSLGGRILSAAPTLYNVHQIYKNEFNSHLDILKKMTKDANIPTAIRDTLDTITSTLLGLNLQQIKAGQLNIRAKSLSSTLDQEFLGLMDTYFDFQSPSRPNTPEMSYELPIEANPDKKEQEKKDMIRLLEPATKILEPANTGLLIAGKIHKQLADIMKQPQNRGVFTKSEREEIEKTSNALDNPPINQKGYLELKEKGREETRLSEALKAGFNLIWSFNELCTDPDPGVLDYIKVYRKASPHLAVLENLVLESEGMSASMRKLYDASIKAILIECRNKLLPEIQQLTKKIHDFEMKNHLRYGALLDEVRPTFDAVETIFLRYGVPVTNPLGNIEEQKTQSEEKLQLKKNEYDSTYKQTLVVRFLNQSLQQFLQRKRFSKPDVLQQLAYLQSFVIINAKEMSAINLVEASLISNLTASERLQLHAKLSKHPEHEKYQSLCAKLEQHQAAITHPVAVPLNDLQTIVTLIKKMEASFNKKLASKTFEYQGHLEALAEQEIIRLEWFSRTLTNNGLNHYLRAIEVAADDKHAAVNLAHKREMAALLADSHHMERITYLETAHSKAKDFLIHRDKIISFVKDIYDNKIAIHNPRLGRELAMELVLSGYTNVNDWNEQILSSSDEQVTRQELLNGLTRLEAGQVLALLEAAKKNDPNALKRLAVFNLLITEDKVSTAAIKNIMQNPPPSSDPMMNWLNLLIKRYQQLSRDLATKQSELPTNMLNINAWISEQPEKELMNKIGLFLTRIANADENAAKIIFARTKPYSILAECLTTSVSDKSHSDKALYYEASVNTIAFNNAYLGINYSQFIDNNQAIILLMHQALTPNSGQTPEETIIYYKTNPLVLSKLTEQFTITCLSSNSRAKDKLRGFFSAMTLCSGMEAANIRQAIFRIFMNMGRSVRAPFVSLLTDTASNPFWQRVREDILSKPKISFDKELREFNETLAPLLNLLPEAGSRNIFILKINDFVHKQTNAIAEALSELKNNKKGDYLLYCSKTQLRIDEAIKSVQKQQSIWIKEIVLQRLEELKSELANAKTELIKSTKVAMNQTDDEFRKSLLTAMNNYNPALELDTLHASMTFSTIEEAVIASKTLGIHKARLLDGMNKQFSSWSEDIADAGIRFKEIKDFRESFNHILTTFNATKKLRSNEKNKLLEPIYKRISILKDIFTHSSNYWQDAGKFYAAIIDIDQLHAHHLPASTELEAFYTRKFNNIQPHTYPKLDIIAIELQQNIARFIHERKPEKINAIIQHFPPPQGDSKLSVTLILGRATTATLELINKIPELMTTPPFIADDAFKLGINIELNQCFDKQKLIAESAVNSLNQKDADAHVILAKLINAQKELDNNIQAIANRIVQQQKDTLRNSIIRTYNKYQLEITNRITNVNASDKSEITTKISRASPTAAFDAFFAEQKLTTIDDKKAAIKAIANHVSVQEKILTIHYQSWLTEAYEKANPAGNKLDEFKTALAQIEGILSSYLSDRKKYALFYSVIGLDLRAKKIAIVTDCLRKINEIDLAFNHSPERYNEYLRDVSQQIFDLETKHFSLVGTNEKKAGFLKGNIDDIYDILRPIQERQIRVGVQP